MDANDTVKISARVPAHQRESLRAILLSGGLTVQDFIGACVEVAVGANQIQGRAAREPLGAVAVLRDQSPRESWRSVARSMMGVDP